MATQGNKVIYTIDIQANAAATAIAQLNNRLVSFNNQMSRTQNSTKQLAANMNNVGKVGRGASLGIQNVAFQVQDFAVQVAAGTAASRALAQQLPQLLGGFGALGAVLGAAAAIFIPLAKDMTVFTNALKTAGENADRFIGYATAVAVLLGGKFLAGMIAARGGMLAFSASVIGAVDSMVTFKRIAITTGIGALAIAIGEAVATFLKLREVTGSWGKAAQVAFQAAQDSIKDLILAFALIAKNGGLVWRAFKAYALNAIADILKAFELLSVRIGDKELFSFSAGDLFDVDSLRTDTQAISNEFSALITRFNELKGGLTEAQKLVYSAFSSDYKIDLFSNVTKDAEKAKTALTDAQRFMQDLKKSTADLTQETSGYTLQLDLMKRGYDELEIERAVELQRLYSEALRAGVTNMDELNVALNEYAAAMQASQEAAKALADEQERIEAIKDTVADIGDAFTSNLLEGINGVIDGTKSAAQAFKEFARSTILEIGKIIVKMLVLNALKTAFGGFGGGGFLSGLLGGLTGFSAPAGAPIARGMVPSIANPLSRAGDTASAIVGAAAQASGGSGDINIFNNVANANVTATKRSDGTTDIVVQEKMQAARISRGGNDLTAALERTYGLTRVR